jgi:hypothetical protein
MVLKMKNWQKQILETTKDIELKYPFIKKKTMKKIIDIPEEIVQDLKILAIKQNKDLKNFIQDELVSLVRGDKKEQNTVNVNSKLKSKQ